MIEVKPGVIWRGRHWRMRKVDKTVELIWPQWGQVAVLTGGLEGTHGAWSWHYYGCASDYRTNYFEDENVPVIADQLRTALGAPYQVVVHPRKYDDETGEVLDPGHIHVEFDPVAFGLDK